MWRWLDRFPHRTRQTVVYVAVVASAVVAVRLDAHHQASIVAGDKVSQSFREQRLRSIGACERTNERTKQISDEGLVSGRRLPLIECDLAYPADGSPPPSLSRIAFCENAQLIVTGPTQVRCGVSPTTPR